MNQPPQSTSGPVVEKKGMPVIAWVGIGCGGILLLAIIGLIALGGMFFKAAKKVMDNPAKASAEFALRANKDLEKVAENDQSGEMTFRVKSTGEEVTLKYDDLAKGRFTVKDKDGKVTQLGMGDVSKVPAWVPRYHGATDETSAMQSEDSTQVAGMMTFTTKDPADDIEKSFNDETAKLSLSSSNRSSMDIQGTHTLNLQYSGGKRELTVTAYGKPGEPTTVQVIYTEKK